MNLFFTIWFIIALILFGINYTIYRKGWPEGQTTIGHFVCAFVLTPIYFLTTICVLVLGADFIIEIDKDKK